MTSDKYHNRIGHWSLVTSHWSLVTSHWSLVTSHWSLFRYSDEFYIEDKIRIGRDEACKALLAISQSRRNEHL